MDAQEMSSMNEVQAFLEQGDGKFAVMFWDGEFIAVDLSDMACVWFADSFLEAFQAIADWHPKLLAHNRRLHS